MDITESIKGIIFKFCISFFSLCTLLWFSVFSYGTLYYLYIPAVAHTIPVHLQYDMSCFRETACHPKFPFDNITLMEGGNEFLRENQGYAIEIVLEMPESERNLNQGMFMIKLDMTNYYGKVIKSSRRPALLHYRSKLFKLFYTLFFMPGLLAGSLEEKQSLMIPLFESYVEACDYPAYYAHIEVQAPAIEVYSSTLRIHAQFTGLRYLMYYWPVTSAVIGIGGHFLFLVVTIGLLWLYESAKKPVEEESSLRPTQRLIARRKTKRERSAERKSGQSPERELDLSGRIESENIEIENISSLSARPNGGMFFEQSSHVPHIYTSGINPVMDEKGDIFFDSLD